MTLVIVGAIVRATGSGLGCPDWPKCHGSWIPPLERSALIEYSHRLTAAIVGLLVFALAVFAWSRWRRVRAIFWPSFGAFLVVVFEGGLGRIVVQRELEPILVLVHFATALTLVGLLTFVTVVAFRPHRHSSSLASESLTLLVVTGGVLLLGSVVTASGAALAFPDWPLMNGGVLPGGTGPEVVHFAHRLAALLNGLLFVYVGVRAVRSVPRDRALVSLAHLSLTLWAAQVVVGAANVFTRTAPWAVALHVGLGAVLWTSVVALATACRRSSRAASPSELERVAARGGALSKVSAYFSLTKPRIIELLLIATVPAMFVAERGVPSIWLILATLIGGSLTAGGANSINNYLDRDIDEQMERTASRPLPQHSIPPKNALIFGIGLGVLGFTWLTVVVNLLSAVLAASAILFYVFVYTIWLKRTTPSNIVIGGAAGSVPVLVGWAAVTGKVEAAAVVMFAIIFYWTPPHFWALSLRYESDYARAGVPMLPVVRGPKDTSRQIFLYALAMFATSLLLFSVARLGLIYLTAAVVLGVLFLFPSGRLLADTKPQRAMSLFRLSTVYLTVLFAAMAADVVVSGTAMPDRAYSGAFLISVAIFAFAKLGVIREVLRMAPSETVSRSAELVWTIIPAIGVAGLFLSSYQAL